MPFESAGIHHITALAGNPQANVDFYSGVLGLRLVKKTVNFDAPDVYHLYFGDHLGSPGTAMTFFPFDGASQGRVGGGQVGYTTFVVPEDSLSFWEERLGRFSIDVERVERFGETYLRFNDTDGLQLEIVERAEGPVSEWAFGGVAVENAIKGFGGAVLYSANPDATMDVLQNVMGFERTGEDKGLVRFKARGELGNYIDVNTAAIVRGVPGSGTVHHIAWRAKDLEDQERWRTHVADAGFNVTPVADRQYFTAIYFRERGGILFEIATDEPGFAIDESVDALGEQLKLPEWLEDRRERVESNLPSIKARVLPEDM